jgi:ParB family chromosome partitioning protein
MARKPALGRGLKALIPDTPRARTGLAQIPVAQLEANPNQPRKHFDEEALAALAASITEHGLLQPLLVSEKDGGGYVVIAGERRLRAARMAGLDAVPAVIRERLEQGADLALALVENLQRRDLTPIEEARAYDQLRLDFRLSQKEIAQRVGVDRSTVANAIRLLKLEPEIQELVETELLSAGHARALLSFQDQTQRQQWGRRAVELGLTVRDLERAAAESRAVDTTKKQKRQQPLVDPNIESAVRRLSHRIGAKVEIRPRARGGSIIIACPTTDELIRVFDLLMEEP